MLALTHIEALAALCPVRSYMEIGVQEGRSLRAVVEASPDLERLVLCDTWGGAHGGTARGSHAHVENLLAELKYTGTVEFLDGLSQVLVPRYLKAHQPPFFDLVLVDGSHDEADALADLRNVWPVTHRVAVHDLVFPAVWRACCTWLPEVEHVATATLAAARHNGLLIVTRCHSWVAEH